MFKQITLAAAAFSSVAMLPSAAEAGQRYRGYSNDYGYSQQQYRGDRYRDDRRYYGRDYRRGGCKSGTTGAIVGAAGGALLGREIAGRGDRTMGTILGAAVGGLAGRELTRTKRCYR
ncbi:MAG TPA: glycine zipper 2TM domain-containing protein [Allosphingosinicella sp.]|jgi:hypothetical protein